MNSDRMLAQSHDWDTIRQRGNNFVQHTCCIAAPVAHARRETAKKAVA